MLPLRPRVNLRAMTMKLYSPNVQRWSLTIIWFNVNNTDSRCGLAYPSIEIQVVYFTAPADSAVSWNNVWDMSQKNRLSLK